MANFIELSKRVDALILDNASITCENHELKKRLEAVLKENKSLTETLMNYYDENRKLKNEIVDVQLKNSNLMEIVEGLEEEVEELDNECNRLSDALEENDGKVIHYIAVSFDLELCVPLVSENPIQAGQELINKCLAKGVPYGGFKVFEKSELL